jgi:hypothetical protein
LNSTGRRRSESLYRIGYDYRADAAGLTGAPFAYASTKSLTAAWASACPRLLTSGLQYDPANPGSISGTIISHLPARLEGAMLNYGGRWYIFTAPLEPGREVNIPAESGHPFAEWMRDSREPESPGARPFDATLMVKTFLFHEKQFESGDRQASTRRNSTLRGLDQSWRIRDVNAPDVYTQEAILYGRLPRQQGPLEETTGRRSSPSRLLLAVTGGSSPPAETALTQDTYLRVYLPVTPQGGRP